LDARRQLTLFRFRELPGSDELQSRVLSPAARHASSRKGNFPFAASTARPTKRDVGFGGSTCDRPGNGIDAIRRKRHVFVRVEFGNRVAHEGARRQHQIGQIHSWVF